LQRYLAEAYDLVGVTIRLIPRNEKNPFAPKPGVRPKQTVKSKANSNARRKKRRK
jgi:hypothetical protein